MAVLKSFELKGNKLSFANWISNLSPTCTPFTCMINKEQLNQNQYSWQTDTLAPATAETFLEGSQAEMQPRAATNVITNFTSTLRRAVSVSDTNQATEVYGRKDETKYQLMKAGKALMRDIEYTNLSKTVGRIGTPQQASQYSGFKDLVAKSYEPDPDTHAIVHKDILTFEATAKTFTLKHIFDLTANLFIAGSKANKIMFHPKHMFLFNDWIAYNEEEPHIHRMFDGMDDKYNAFVSKIKDPLGRVYDLISNRFMPEDEMYFFNEKDWTQMVLRAPQRIKRGKTGSAETYFIETELGLRHKHPFASGVLSAVVVERMGTLEVTRKVLTAGLHDEADFRLEVNDKDYQPVPTLPIVWEISDNKVIRVDPPIGSTNSSGVLEGVFVAKDVGFTTVRAKGNKCLSNAFEIEVRPPVMELSLDTAIVELGKHVTATAYVKKQVTDAPAPDGTEVVWRTNSEDLVFVDKTSGAIMGTTTTTATVNGQIDVDITARRQGTFQVWYSVGGMRSVSRTITVNRPLLTMEWTKSETDRTLGVHGATEFEAVIRNKDGSPVAAGTPVTFISTNTFVARMDSADTLVGAGGVVKAEISPSQEGSSQIYLECYGNSISKALNVHLINIDGAITPNTMAVGDTAEVAIDVLDHEFNPVVGKRVSLRVVEGHIASVSPTFGTTDSNGNVTSTLTALENGKTFVIASCLGVDSDPIPVYIGTGIEVDFRIVPSPTQIGRETTFNVHLEGKDGRAIVGKEVYFTSNPTIPGLDTLRGTTDAGGWFTDKFTPVTDINAQVTAHVTDFNSVDTENLVFEERVLTYTLVGDDTKMTVGVDKTYEVEVTVTDSGGNAVANAPMKFSTDPKGKVRVTARNNGNTDSSGKIILDVVPLTKGTTTIKGRVVGKNNRFTSKTITVADPILDLEITPNPVAIHKVVAMKVTLKDANGTPIPGINVGVVSVPSFSVLIPEAATDGNGEYTISRTVNVLDNHGITAFISGYVGLQKTKILEVVPSTYDHTFSGHTTPTTAYLGKKLDVTTNVKEGGVNVTDLEVEFVNDTPELMNVSHKSATTTDPWGNHILEIEALKHGTGKVRVRGSGSKAYESFEVDLREPIVTLTISPNPRPNSGNVVFTMFVTDHNGVAAASVGGTIISDPTPDNRTMVGTTNSSGSMKFTRSISDGFVRKVYGHLTNHPDIRSIDHTLTVQ